MTKRKYILCTQHSCVYIYTYTQTNINVYIYKYICIMYIYKNIYKISEYLIENIFYIFLKLTSMIEKT